MPFRFSCSILLFCSLLSHANNFQAPHTACLSVEYISCGSSEKWKTDADIISWGIANMVCAFNLQVICSLSFLTIMTQHKYQRYLNIKFSTFAQMHDDFIVAHLCDLRGRNNNEVIITNCIWSQFSNIVIFTCTQQCT